MEPERPGEALLSRALGISPPPPTFSPLLPLSLAIPPSPGIQAPGGAPEDVKSSRSSTPVELLSRV